MQTEQKFERCTRLAAVNGLLEKRSQNESLVDRLWAEQQPVHVVEEVRDVASLQEALQLRRQISSKRTHAMSPAQDAASEYGWMRRRVAAGR